MGISDTPRITRNEMERERPTLNEELAARVSALEADRYSWEQEARDLRSRLNTAQEQIAALGREAGHQAALAEQFRLERDSALQDRHVFGSSPSPREVKEEAVRDHVLETVVRQRNDAMATSRKMQSTLRHDTDELQARLREARQAAKEAALNTLSMPAFLTAPSASAAAQVVPRDDAAAMMTLMRALQREAEFYCAAATTAVEFARKLMHGEHGALGTTAGRAREAQR